MNAEQMEPQIGLPALISNENQEGSYQWAPDILPHGDSMYELGRASQPLSGSSVGI